MATAEMMTHSDPEESMLQSSQLHMQNHVSIQFPRDKVSTNLIKPQPAWHVP